MRQRTPDIAEDVRCILSLRVRTVKKGLNPGERHFEQIAEDLPVDREMGDLTNTDCAGVNTGDHQCCRVIVKALVVVSDRPSGFVKLFETYP